MGVVHFTGLGKSPGAVTSGLAYLKHEIGPSFEDGTIVDAVVIFTSEEVASGREKCFPAEHNEYMKREVRKRWARDEYRAVEIVKCFLQKEFVGTEIYLIKINVNDFSKCFEAVAKALLRFHPPGKVGKHIWANLTGGTNVLNAALLQSAYLSGLIPRVYYTFVANPRDDGKYLQPFSRDTSEFDYREIYIIPTTFDERYRYLLEELRTLRQEEWIAAQDLLGRLKGKSSSFSNLSLDEFIRNYLNIWPGIQRKGSRSEGQENAVRLSKEGQKMLELWNSAGSRRLWNEELLLMRNVIASSEA